MAKEYFSFTGKIPFEGKVSKNVMAFHYYEQADSRAGLRIW